MPRLRYFGPILFAALFALSGCDKTFDAGLGPLNNASGFSGRVTFKNWSAGGDVIEMRLVVFKEFPSDSSAILSNLLNRQAFFYPRFGLKGFNPYHDDVTDYVFNDHDAPLDLGEYKYVVVAYRYDINDYSKWRPAGVYTRTPPSFNNSSVLVLLHKTTPNIDITVDFANLPPKPWN
jgi:hypothetical protein